MKRIPVPEILLVVLAGFALLTVWFAWNEHRDVKKLRASLYVDGNKMVFNTFYNELEDYGRKNPAVTPILRAFGIGQASAPTASQSNPPSR